MKRLLLALSVLLGLACTLYADPPHVISDQNAATVVADGIKLGHGTGYVMGANPTKLRMKFGVAFQAIPRSQWKAMVKAGQGTFLGDLIRSAKMPATDQDGLSFCWAYASTETAMVGRLIQGQPFVMLSPESVGGPVTGWRNQGGYGIDALNQLVSKGACAASFMDQANSLRPSRWKAGWEADCANHKIVMSVASLESFDEVFTALLYRMPVSIGLDWWSHQVMLTDPIVFDDGSFGVGFRNSWGEDWPSQGAGGWSTLTERKSQPSGAFAVISVGISDVDLNGKATPASLVKKREALMRKLIERNVNEGACKP